MWADFTSAHLFGYTAQADDYLACAAVNSMWADFTSAHLFGYTAQADDYLACAGKRGTMSTQKGNQKHLTLSDRINIEKGLNNSDSFAAIARLVHKDPTTISKEVRKRIQRLCQHPL